MEFCKTGYNVKIRKIPGIQKFRQLWERHKVATTQGAERARSPQITLNSSLCLSKVQQGLDPSATNRHAKPNTHTLFLNLCLRQISHQWQSHSSESSHLYNLLYTCDWYQVQSAISLCTYFSEVISCPQDVIWHPWRNASYLPTARTSHECLFESWLSMHSQLELNSQRLFGGGGGCTSCPKPLVGNVSKVPNAIYAVLPCEQLVAFYSPMLNLDPAIQSTQSCLPSYHSSCGSNRRQETILACLHIGHS